MRSRTLLAVAVGTLFGSGAAARSEVAVIDAAKDNTLYESVDGSSSNGSGAVLFVGRVASGDIRRTVIQFDIATRIPAGSTINSVTLAMEMDRSPGSDATDVALHPLDADWGEGASFAGPDVNCNCNSVNCSGGGGGDNSATGDATWQHTFYSTSFWTVAGGAYNGTASATTSVRDIGPYTWGSTSAMVTDVQDWLDGTTPNYGWILIGDESVSPTSKRFDSREAVGACDVPPTLTVDYTPPAGTGACCFGDGSCTVETSGDCGTAGGRYEGDGTSCSPNPCPQPMGACCAIAGTCSIETENDCTTAGGFYQGDGTTCAGNPCIGLTGACCLSGAVCRVLMPADCDTLGGEFLGPDVPCSPNECPLNLEPYRDLLPTLAVAVPELGIPGGAASYRILIEEFDQQLHRDLPPTRVWGYDGVFPGPTIEARSGLPVNVKWVNNLRDDMGNLRTDHYLAVDLCPHGADDGPPRTVVHLHGGHVPSVFDGDPEDTVQPAPGLTAFNDFNYPNGQNAATLWYHDHALGTTRLNVYMGLVGFYLLRDDWEDGLELPDGAYEIAMAIQDRSFNQDGTLYYPSAWQDHFFGEYILVNGMVWPFKPVDQGKYRFRLLNGSGSRTYTLALEDGSGIPPTFWQIGTDGGLLPAPVPLTELTISPGERADIVVDFEGYSANDVILLTNSAPAPYPGDPGAGVVPEVMKFIVTPNAGFTSALPAMLRPVPPLLVGDVATTREFELNKMFVDYPGTACDADVWFINGLAWDDITEIPTMNTTELWKFINLSGVTHPMHLHLDFHQVVGRQPFTLIDGVPTPTGPVVHPDANEVGWKDTTRANPDEILWIIAQFTEYTGDFPYHCHILEHEDHEMMRQFQVALPCNGDCGDADGIVGIVDFLAVLAQWGQIGTSCDLDNDGTGITDFLRVLGTWGPCP